MSVGSRDSYLKSLPAVKPFLDRVARYRLKGFHREERTGDGNELDVVATYPILPPWGLGTPKWTRDATANDSDKSFAVPAGKVWDMKGYDVTLVTTAKAGNRVLYTNVLDASANILTRVQTSLNIAASTTYRVWGSFTGITDDLALTGPASTNIGQGAMPMILTAGMALRVWDGAVIDAAADDLTVVLHYVEYDAP